MGKSLQFGLFDFEPETTLLLWCTRADDVAPLLGLLDQLARERYGTFVLNETMNARAVDETSVRFEVASDAAVLVETAGAGRLVRMRCSAARCAELRDQLSIFGEPSSRPGHHYLEISPHQPIQIIVSVAEYPPDLRPGAPVTGP